MKKLYSPVFFLFLLLIPVVSAAQTTHEVVASGMSFSPATLQIEVGDMVHWTNQGGFHNVNGTQATFAANPESFGNELAGAPWDYSFTFTIAGTYQFQCDQHSAMMQGTITVSEGTSAIDEIDADAGFLVYPNPAIDQLRWTTANLQLTESAVLTVYSIIGTEVKAIRVNGMNLLDVSDLPQGLYTYALIDEQETKTVGKFLIQR